MNEESCYHVLIQCSLLCALEFGSCQTGWKDFGQYCYQFNLAKKSWSSARVSCVNQQADLVSIHSPVEQAHIALETGPYGLQSVAWIGRVLFYSFRNSLCYSYNDNSRSTLNLHFHEVVSSHSTK